jgi:phosphatidylinositol glycan class B
MGNVDECGDGLQPVIGRLKPAHILGVLIAAVIVAQIYLAIRYYGFLTGDDVEVLEEAFHRAVGLTYQPWDVRNLFVPDLLVAPFVFLGGHDVARAIWFATIPFIALTALTIWLVYRLAVRWSGDELAAVTAAALFALHWIPLGFGSTVYPRTLATACIVAAALLIERTPFAAGLLVGVAFADRFSEIVFLIPLLVLARRRAWIVVLGAALSMAITVGLYDWITWGTPFSSVINFAKLTLVEPDFASRVKYQSPLWYLYNIARWCAPTLLPLLYFGRKSTRWILVIVPLFAFSLVRHKELRYLQGAIPFLMIMAGVGFGILYRRRRAIAVALLLISLLWDLHGLRYFARKSMPAVMAARALASDARVNKVIVSQLWAYGDRLYFGRKAARDVGTPPRDLEAALQGADAAALYETDFDHPELLPTLRRNGFVPWRTFRDGPARPVVVFRRMSSRTE